MINLVTGLPGSGKTLYTLGKVNELAIKEGREVYYHGIPDLTLPWILMDSPEDWVNLPTKSIIVIDECQSTFRPRAASVKPPLYISEFETHRHKGLDFFLLTQHPMLIDGNIRRLAGKHFHVIRFYGFQKSTIHEFQSVRDNVDKNQKNSIATHFIFPKDVFNWYKSADAHTMKRRIPMRLVMVIILPFVLVGLLYYGYTVLVKLRSQPSENFKKLETSQGIVNADSPSGSTVSQVPKKLTFIEARTPAIINVAYSAPVYADLVKPVVAPFPAACIVSKSKGCHCFTQQGTPYQTDDAQCRLIVEGGLFIDWQMQGKGEKQMSERLPPNGIIKGEPLDAKPTISQSSTGMSLRSSPAGA